MTPKQQLEQVIAEMRDYARQTWSHDAEAWASRLSAIMEQMPSASAICNISSFSSRMCEYGTKGCTTQHAAPPVPDGMVLVPREPGIDLVEAFYRAYERPLIPDRWESRFDNAWEAMIAAAEKQE